MNLQLEELYKHRDAFYDIFTDLMICGREVSPRGQLVLEIENYVYLLPPYVRFANFKSRKFNLDYVKQEFLWYLKGDRFDTSITKHAKMWKSLINNDGSINSNYGQYVFGDLNQFDNVVQILKNDRDSRRASIVILNDRHLLSDTKDVPCTYALNFRIRENKLNMSVHMRSQDAIFGMCNDAPTFSFIHEMMYVTLKEYYEDLNYGFYYHIADSFHVYERHFDMLKAITADDDYEFVNCPKMHSADEIKFLRECNFESIPDDFKFSQWLVKKG